MVTIHAVLEYTITRVHYDMYLNNSFYISYFQEAPFVVRSENVSNPDVPFHGFLVDLMEEISYILNFTYIMYESPDGNYGLRNEDGEWNGMMHELITGVGY